MSYPEIMRSVYSEAGVRGFFVGWRLRYALYFLHAVMTVDLLERLEYWKNKINKEN